MNDSNKVEQLRKQLQEKAESLFDDSNFTPKVFFVAETDDNGYDCYYYYVKYQSWKGLNS